MDEKDYNYGKEGDDDTKDGRKDNKYDKGFNGDKQGVDDEEDGGYIMWMRGIIMMVRRVMMIRKMWDIKKIWM